MTIDKMAILEMASVLKITTFPSIESILLFQNEALVVCFLLYLENCFVLWEFCCMKYKHLNFW